jgi:hypothetical protein
MNAMSTHADPQLEAAAAAAKARRVIADRIAKLAAGVKSDDLALVVLHLAEAYGYLASEPPRTRGLVWLAASHSKGPEIASKPPAGGPPNSSTSYTSGASTGPRPSEPSGPSGDAYLRRAPDRPGGTRRRGRWCSASWRRWSGGSLVPGKSTPLIDSEIPDGRRRFRSQTGLSIPVVTHRTATSSNGPSAPLPSRQGRRTRSSMRSQRPV